MTIYVQINAETNKLEQCVAFGDDASFKAHVEANPQSTFVIVNSWVSPRTHKFNRATESLVERTDAKRVKILSYAEERRNLYPSIGDQLDALWSGGEEEKKMRAKIMAVKTRLPKKEKP